MWAHNLDLEFVRVTEATALASARLMGRGDEAAAQKAAVTTMHDLLSRGPLRCRVVVGEGESGQVSRLANGEILGDGDEAVADVALDALEGTNICASGRPNSISVMAMTEIWLSPLPWLNSNQYTAPVFFEFTRRSSVSPRLRNDAVKSGRLRMT